MGWIAAAIVFHTLAELALAIWADHKADRRHRDMSRLVDTQTRLVDAATAPPPDEEWRADPGA